MDYQDEESFSPVSCNDSEADSDDLGYQTPLTSPDTSPRKKRPAITRLPLLRLPVRQLDGEGDFHGDPFVCDLETPALESAWDIRPPKRLDYERVSTPRTPSRNPTILLQHCEKSATPRQRQLMKFGTAFSDRFIPSRSGTPNKESLLLSTPARTGPLNGKPNQDAASDPFAPAVRRSIRVAEQYAVLRCPVAPARPTGFTGSRVDDGNAQPMDRIPQTPTAWTVGGSAVTEGVNSTTNSRGGRTTSGTSAPHYNADFLRRRSHSTERLMHGRRLALAMDIDQSGKMIRHDTVAPCGVNSSPLAVKQTIWRHNRWEAASPPSTPSDRKQQRTKEIPIVPFRVLDAPALRDDYYCSLLAHSPTMRCLAVGLASHVYLWSEPRGTAAQNNVPDSLISAHNSHVTSLSFSSAGGGSSILAIGRADGRITLWSPLDSDPRFDSQQPAPVSYVSFRPTVARKASLRDPNVLVDTEDLLVGDEVGNIYVYSIEWPSRDQRDLFDWHGSMTLLARISCHSQQICGIAWSADGEYFASGGNDNQLFVFETRKLMRDAQANVGSVTPVVRVRNRRAARNLTPFSNQGLVSTVLPGQEKHVFTLNAAVKAIAFAPWQSSLLAAGGGSNDRCIHFFHTLSRASLATIDCHAQVTSLVWNDKRKEIAATLGFAQPKHPYRVAVFAWPSCDMIVGIPWWSEERALYAISYPGGPMGSSTNDRGCLVIATSDASIKFHEVWPERKKGPKRAVGGLESQILNDTPSPDMERNASIR